VHAGRPVISGSCLWLGERGDAVTSRPVSAAGKNVDRSLIRKTKNHDWRLHEFIAWPNSALRYPLVFAGTVKFESRKFSDSYPFYCTTLTRYYLHYRRWVMSYDISVPLIVFWPTHLTHMWTYSNALILSHFWISMTMMMMTSTIMQLNFFVHYRHICFAHFSFDLIRLL